MKRQRIGWRLPDKDVEVLGLILGLVRMIERHLSRLLAETGIPEVVTGDVGSTQEVTHE